MTYKILLRNDPATGYVATSLTWPGCVIEAPTREEALSGMQDAISELLRTSEIIEMDIPLPSQGEQEAKHPGFGMFRDDPTFDEFVEEVRTYRQLQDEVDHE